MRVAVLRSPTSHSTSFLGALIRGIEFCGDETATFASPNGRIALPGFDAAVCWGWRRGKALRIVNPQLPVLVMERGYVGDRFKWSSLGWNGLNRRATFPKAQHSRLGLFCIDQWRNQNRPGYALILGQVQSDQACLNVNLAYQYRSWQALLARAGYQVRFRPHPKALKQSSGLQSGCYTRNVKLADDLRDAKFTISWNSNASVESVLAGVPSVTFDEGAMAWPVTSHDLNNPVTMPSRTEWAAQLAWCQWEPSELSSGAAWRAVREVKP